VRLLALFLPPDDVEVISGDLEEGFRENAARHGRRRATWWYWRQVLYEVSLGIRSCSRR